MAHFFETREVPQIGKIAALLWFDRLNRAVVAFEKNAFAIRFVEQGQSISVTGKPGVSLDEIEFAQFLEHRQSLDFFVGQPHLARPSAASGATLAFIENWHVGI